MPRTPKKPKGPLAIALGKRIEALRLASGVLSQEAWQHRAKLKRQSTISDWETGKSFTQLDKIGAALAAIGVTLFLKATPSAKRIVLNILRGEAAVKVRSADGIE